MKKKTVQELIAELNKVEKDLDMLKELGILIKMKKELTKDEKSK